MSQRWEELVRQHLAVSSVGGSTLMMQAGKHRVRTARNFLVEEFPLEPMDGLTERKFNNLLDKKTLALSGLLLRPLDNEPNWGAARKVLNIYLRLVCMNKDTHRKYRLKKIEPFLEVPLDAHVVKRIDQEAGTDFARTFRIKNLTPDTSRTIQNAADAVAMRKGVYRYELDALFWRRAN